MRFRVLVLLVLVASLSACKIRITVPPGGSVETESGAFSCASGSVCEIDVVDSFFDETFVVVADQGNSFVSWQSGRGKLCGKSSEPCRLFTLGFSDIPELVSVLESDLVFELEPFFARTAGSGSLRSLPMRVCLDRRLLRPGYKSDITRQFYDSRGAKEGTSRTQTRVTGPVSYLGTQVMKRTESVENFGVLRSTLELISYSKVNFAQLKATILGVDQESFTPVAQIAKATFSPGFVQRFNLAVGASYTTDYTMEITFPNGESPTLMRNISTRITYEGVETIDIPAGSFEACRLHRFDNVDGDVSESYNWIGKGNGLILRQSDADFVPEVEIKSGTVMGNDL